MPGFSIWHLLIIAALVLVIFGGGGKLSQLMGDAGKGMKAFKDGLKDEEEEKNAKKDATKKVDNAPDA